MKSSLGLFAGILFLGFAVPHVPPSVTKPVVLAHYMPWFRAEPSEEGIVWDHWQWFGKGKKHDPDRVLDNGRRDIASAFYPLVGPYDSRDPAVIEYHVLTARAAGIDGFVADWYGPETYTDEVFAHVMRTAERYGLKMAICLEEKSFYPPYSTAQSRADLQGVMEQQIRHVLEKYAVSDAYLRHNGRPVLFIFNGYDTGPLGPNFLSPEEVGQVLERFARENVLLVRKEFEAAYAPVCGGAYSWAGDAAYREGFYTSAVPARAAGTVEWVVGGVSPGFDDTAINGWGNGPRVTDRRGTKEYAENWDDIFRYRPDAVQIATWNDFQEGTTIEPAEPYGYSFVNHTEKYVARYTGRKANWADNEWPRRILNARRALQKVDEPVAALWTDRIDDFIREYTGGRMFMMSWKLGRLESKIGRLELKKTEM